MNEQEMMNFTGLNERTIKGYERLYPLLLVHEVAVEALACTDGKLKKATIDIPNIGTIRYNTKKGTYSFKPTNRFNIQVRNAVEKGYSPLLDEVSKTMVDMINNQYKSLL